MSARNARHTIGVPKEPKPLETLSHAESIEEVLDSIDKIIGWSIANSSRVGYFAALYKRITLAVQKAIADKKFEDGARMERFDAAFASRYFDALNGHFHPPEFDKPTQTWQVSLDAASLAGPIIVQHLLGACNAHIALDLGITAHKIASGDLPGLHNDFNTINVILAGQASDVIKSIDKLSPVLADVHALLKDAEIDFTDDSLTYLRDNAWEFAQVLSREPDPVETGTIVARDAELAERGRMIYDPPIPMTAIFDAVAEEEQRNVATNIRVLDEIASRPYKPTMCARISAGWQYAGRELYGLASASLEHALAAIGNGNTTGKDPSQGYVRYDPELDRPREGEEETIQELVDALHRNNEWTFKTFKHGMRDAHAKSHAVLEGELVIDPDLPPHLCQGLFATPATYPVIARISSTQPTIHSDQIRGIRAIAIKVLGVHGPRALEDDDASTQDFVMVDSPEFPFADARHYLQIGMPIAAALTRMPDWALMALTEPLGKVVDLTEMLPPPLRVPIPSMIKLFTNRNYYVLGLEFNTASALRYGDYVAKISVKPLSESVKRLQKRLIPRGLGDDAHRILIADFFRENDAEYDVCAQLCTDVDAIEDATVVWSTSPPPERVAKLIFRQQNSDCYCRRAYADDVLSFNSWRTLEAHRPLGSINRLKAKVYDASSKFRHEKNNAPQIEPSDIDQLPSCPPL